jgi:hypothetical protein
MGQQEQKGFFRGLVDRITGSGQPQADGVEPPTPVFGAGESPVCRGGGKAARVRPVFSRASRPA